MGNFRAIEKITIRRKLSGFRTTNNKKMILITKHRCETYIFCRSYNTIEIESDHVAKYFARSIPFATILPRTGQWGTIAKDIDNVTYGQKKVISQTKMF